ncbi:hypothetical protein NDU88_003862 [Pleurodeles waltl]|uniref:Uncharacterized protein n=1 Tax=Pleurodeles waltl TaxID=8319 RepID=A0AAV7RHU0_PLEWA|nr:hypothetical protein NDU88_003862 [Pleurodeles waltl]
MGVTPQQLQLSGAPRWDGSCGHVTMLLVQRPPHPAAHVPLLITGLPGSRRHSPPLSGAGLPGSAKAAQDQGGFTEASLASHPLPSTPSWQQLELGVT